MNYIQIVFSLNRQEEWKIDLFKDSLLDIGADSFVDTQYGFEAYCPEKDFKEELLKPLIDNSLLDNKEDISYITNVILDQNWNEVWEETSPSVRFGNECLIRKDTHEKDDNVTYDIIINPKQSFGTATHPTTAMIIRSLLSMKTLKGCSVMDMGCGTAVLAILAKKMGAEYVEAIDNDTWAYNNALENVNKNNVDICVKLGSSNEISENKLFDIFIANINLNILIDNMESFTSHVKTKGLLILSGFYKTDIKELCDKTKPYGFTFISESTQDDWSEIILRKD